MPLELGHRARLRVTIQKGNVCLFPGDNVEFCRACLPGTYIFVWRGSALWWINPENWTPRHTKTCASSLMPARHRFFLIFAAWLRREALRTLQQASWGVNLTLPLVYCLIRIACDQLKVVFFFFSSCARYRYANNEKATAVAKAFCSLQLLIVKPDC